MNCDFFRKKLDTLPCCPQLLISTGTPYSGTWALTFNWLNAGHAPACGVSVKYGPGNEQVFLNRGLSIDRRVF